MYFVLLDMLKNKLKNIAFDPRQLSSRGVWWWKLREGLKREMGGGEVGGIRGKGEGGGF
jgi:hypothetical protein